MRSLPFKKNRVVFLFIHVLLVAGCQPKVYLMPSPIGLQSGASFYDRTQDNKDDNRLTTLYATNRIPNAFSFESDGYTIFPSDDLRVGFVTHSVGDDDDTWEYFYEKSLNRGRKDKLLISMGQVNEMLMIEDVQSIEVAMPENQKILDQINGILAKNADKDLTIYESVDLVEFRSLRYLVRDQGIRKKYPQVYI